MMWVCPLLAFVIALGVTWALVCYRGRWAILDHPNDRSLHEAPRPRSGGVAVVVGIAVSGAILLSVFDAVGRFPWFALSALIVAAISFADDIRNVPPLVRFALHGVAAIIAVVVGGLIVSALDFPYLDIALPQWVAVICGILYLVWMLNLYNFMDGIDGLAGGMAVLGFATLAVLGWLGGSSGFALLSACVAAASAGFLVFNFSPARIFMGDVGSGTLGFLAGMLTLWGARAGVFSFWVGVLVFSPFVVDATWTLLRRIAAGEKPWQAHRNHAYQCLVQAGWSHRRTTLVEYGLMALCGGSAILVAVIKSPVVAAAVFVAWILIYIVLVVSVTRRTVSGVRETG